MASNYGSHKSTGTRRSKSNRSSTGSAAQVIIQEAAREVELLVKKEALMKHRQLAREEEEIKWKRQSP